MSVKSKKGQAIVRNARTKAKVSRHVRETTSIVNGVGVADVPERLRPPAIRFPIVKQAIEQAARLRLIDEQMDNGMVEEVAVDMVGRLSEKRAEGAGQWWDAQRCTLDDLNRRAQAALANGNFLDAAVFCSMMHVRMKAV